MSSPQLSTVPAVAQSPRAYDFAAPQSTQTSQEVLTNHEINNLRTLLLRQLRPDRQSFIPFSGDAAFNYTIKVNRTDGLMHRKPHMIISRALQEGRNDSVTSVKSLGDRRRSSIFGSDQEQDKACVAEVRFNHKDMGRNEIHYKDSGHTQTLSEIDGTGQTCACQIAGKKHCWRPLGPSESVLELVNETNDRKALFVYSTDEVGVKAPLKVEKDIGELHMIENIKGEMSEQEEMLCTALAMVERARRRAASGANTSTVYKQGHTGGVGD